ncbi:MAG: hypothetical protein U0169_06355 [Polyangiaceae bacterium]
MTSRGSTLFRPAFVVLVLFAMHCGDGTGDEAATVNYDGTSAADASAKKDAADASDGSAQYTRSHVIDLGGGPFDSFDDSSEPSETYGIERRVDDVRRER